MTAKHYEDILVAGLVGSEWRIDPDGSVWRIAACSGGMGGAPGKRAGRAAVRPIVPRRAEIPALDGYHRIQGNPWGAGQKRALAHRVVWVYFNGPVPDGMQVNHKNGIKTDNRPENLELVTPQQNCLHRHRGLGHKAPGGYRTGSVKLSPADVVAMRTACIGGASEVELAHRYSVEPKTIHDAATGKTWREIGGPRLTKDIQGSGK